MADITSTSEVLRIPRIDPQRRAWGILLLSFAAFALICVVTGIGLSYFFFESTVPLESILRVGRGTGSVTGQSVYNERMLSNGDEVTTDRQSQIVIFFRDTQQDDKLIAAVTVRGGTSLVVRRTQRPRFEWGAGIYGVDLRNLRGEIEIFVTKDLGREFRLTVSTVQGDLVDLSTSGQYFISASDARLQVVNREGSISMVAANQNEGRSIPVNSQGTIVYETDPKQVTVNAAYTNLLANSTFQDINTVNQDSGVPQALVLAWACSNRQVDLPRGDYHPEIKDGRWTMRLVRSDGATSNGETRCLSYFGQSRQDVSQYSYVGLRATFNINYQSLDTCGQAGSECPLMIQMDYLDEKGEFRRWFHGFYSRDNPQSNYPLQCNSCFQEHEIINPQSWYTYDSGNMLNLFPPGERPTSIINVQFYASGHEYDVYVGEVALLVGSTDAAP